jgi:hypothetical protein
MTVAHQPVKQRTLGLTLCQLAVPALAIPSAIGVAKFFSVADRASHWTVQGVIAAAGFELMNVGLSVLDIRHPALHPKVQRVRSWSIATAIAFNVIAHYGQRVPGLDQIDVVGGLLALIASVPLAVLYVALAGLLHAMSEGDHAETDERAGLHAELAKAREEVAAKARDLARVNTELAKAREASATELARVSTELARVREEHAAELASIQGEAREGAQGLTSELARVQAELASEHDQLARVTTQAREAEARSREEIAAAREASAAELREARGVATRAERETQRLTREVEALRQELAARADRSRDALVREAQQLQAERGWGASEIGRHLGWSESTIRSWLQSTRTASAAD